GVEIADERRELTLERRAHLIRDVGGQRLEAVLRGVHLYLIGCSPRQISGSLRELSRPRSPKVNTRLEPQLLTNQPFDCDGAVALLYRVNGAESDSTEELRQ